jgi:transposase
MTQQGKELSHGQKLSIIALKKSYEEEKKGGSTVSTKDSTGRISRGLGIGRRTVENVLSKYNKNGQNLVEVSPKPRGKPPLRVSGDLIPHIRHHIRSANMQGGHISVRNLRGWILQEFDTDIPIMTLWRALQRIGFSYGKNKRRSALKERDYVVAARRRYLRERILNRHTQRSEVYLDETFINKNHSNDNTWYLDVDGPWVNKPSGKGQRLIIVHAITAKGWVDGAQLVFRASTGTGDYHGQMNYDNFSKWFTSKLLPNIPDSSTIIMDNAKYHNILADDTFPTPRSKKAELQSWLENNYPGFGYHDDPSMLKAELYEICKKNAPPPKFKLDLIAKEQGHRILRTPPYHCELQPIESCWGVVKNYCRDHCDFSMTGLQKHLEIGFSKVTQSTCEKLIEKVRKQEDAFWKEDSELDLAETIEERNYESEPAYIDEEDEYHF